MKNPFKRVKKVHKQTVFFAILPRFDLMPNTRISFNLLIEDKDEIYWKIIPKEVREIVLLGNSTNSATIKKIYHFKENKDWTFEFDDSDTFALESEAQRFCKKQNIDAHRTLLSLVADLSEKVDRLTKLINLPPIK